MGKQINGMPPDFSTSANRFVFSLRLCVRFIEDLSVIHTGESKEIPKLCPLAHVVFCVSQSAWYE